MPDSRIKSEQLYLYAPALILMTIYTQPGDSREEERAAIEKASPTGNDFFFRAILSGGLTEYVWKLFKLDTEEKIVISIKEAAPEGLIVYKPNGSKKTTIQVVIITSSSLRVYSDIYTRSRQPKV